MKKAHLLIGIAASFVIFVSASVWEGAAAVSGEFPETGLYMATNSFPLNTVVDVTNLENGKKIPLIVSSGIESSGFLALLSKDAADALGIPLSSLARIRMSESKTPAVFSRPGGAEIASAKGDDTETESGEPLAEETADTPSNPPLPEGEDGDDFNFTDVELSMVPAETRPPENKLLLDPASFVAGTEAGKAPLSSSGVPQPESFVPPVTDTPLVEEPVIDSSKIIEPVGLASTASSPAVISVPVISRLEKGKYYLQLAAYFKAELAEREISKLDGSLPAAVMEFKDDRFDKPVYRVLIGPVNLGESGALLQRYKDTYKDAFVRLGTQ